jgi:very-short-patch-repair endonuclease
MEEITAEELLARYGDDVRITTRQEVERRSLKPAEQDWEEALLLLMRAENLPEPKSQYRFYRGRRWAFDFAWPQKKVAVEVEGGTWGNPVTCHACGKTVRRQTKKGRWYTVREGGRHNTGKGFESDVEKYTMAALLGWRVVRVTTNHIRKGQAIDWIRRALAYSDLLKTPK